MEYYVTMRQFSEMLGRSYGTVLSWRDRGLLPETIRDGKSLLMKLSDAERWISNNESLLSERGVMCRTTVKK